MEFSGYRQTISELTLLTKSGITVFYEEYRAKAPEKIGREKKMKDKRK
jgi:hypothetical protein